eukprot:TRINITY_DN40608_c0_g1_i1.p1 TRINITY_DN40608_c0_g1~~TRINITY_DN40608_c0_g1_i1.p1  ORF type:complete len:462 (+),score=100.01 TRINITY_DN40608_c0_g1_i1:75-1460(+)
MECTFDLAARLGFPDTRGPVVGLIDKACLPRGALLETSELGTVVDALGEQSAAVRGLQTAVEDNRLPGIQASEDTVYLLAEGRYALGFARIAVRHILVAPSDGSDADAKKEPSSGSKGGYAAYGQNLQKMSPSALLDFYVVGGFQRRGLGRMLLEATLKQEAIEHPARLAYSRVSQGILDFLRKHYALDKSRQVTSYTLFDEFFEETLPVMRTMETLPGPGAGPLKAAAMAEEEEPKIEEEESEPTSDPLAPYRLVEKETYTQRAKLYCFNENQWQDAGAGQVTFLKNESSGRVRLVFVQEAGVRVIANHFIVNQADMCELKRHTAGNDKAWMWTAKERVLERTFALKFRTVDDAVEFQEAFNGVKRLAVESDAQPYRLLRTVGATAEQGLNSRHIQVLPPASQVNILEAVYDAEQKRVRGRIVAPAGWITLMSHNAADAGCYAVASSDLDAYSALPKTST